MAQDVKAGVGYIIPAAAVIGFITALVAEQFLIAVFIAVAGLLLWFLYSLVMEASLPDVTGNFIILFSILLAVGIFFAYGLEQTMFGGYQMKAEGGILSLIILLFGILAGVLFNRGRQPAAPGLSDTEKGMVKKALESEGETSEAGKEPRVIVVKQEPAEKEKDTEQAPAQPEYPYGDYDPYLYPPPGYYDYDYDEDEDADETGYEDDEDYEYDEEDYEEDEEEEEKE